MLVYVQRGLFHIQWRNMLFVENPMSKGHGPMLSLSYPLLPWIDLSWWIGDVKTIILQYPPNKSGIPNRERVQILCNAMEDGRKDLINLECLCLIVQRKVKPEVNRNAGSCVLSPC